MKNGKIEDIMANMKQPKANVSQHKKAFRFTLLNISPKRSAIVGILFLILPMLFLSGVLLKHYMQIDFGIFTSVYEWIGDIDRRFGDHSFLNWVIRILLLFGPTIAIAINLLAILHIRYEKKPKEIVMSIKVKWLNWIIILVCTLIFSVFFLYLVVENAGGG